MAADYAAVPPWDEVPFFKGQKKIVLRNCGLINPDDIEEYIAIGGYQSLRKVLRDGTPETVNEQLKLSRLRGRGGAGFSTGLKFEYLRKAVGDRKYLICNADEGDPGAYMNRNELESDPHSLLEGMAIGGYVTGPPHGIIYVRAEYPLAVHRLNLAIAQARDTAFWARTSWGAASTLTSNWSRVPARSFAARRPRSSVRWKADRDARGRVRLIPRKRACGAIRPTSTTWRPGSISRRSLRKARHGSPGSAARPVPEPRSSRSSAR